MVIVLENGGVYGWIDDIFEFFDEAEELGANVEDKRRNEGMEILLKLRGCICVSLGSIIYYTHMTLTW
eukprot:CAMPEP_0197238890 /NCGR_PEP_ID=MMETSP1429-20130617/5406_1 /TAXON_ID=49237 /ORGANISM="Chaetoceros  sp., Strain UNC1202" /LENGTH=67 /DNA_ID=CAMNT_0042698175 /DNA_START=51 /DNA_END=254 /DNA_ORIENTATION=+